MAEKKLGCLILHGLTSSLDCVNGLVPYMERNGIPYRMPILRGHGTKQEDLIGVTWRDWYADGEAALLDLCKEVDKAVVVGLSMGGLVGLQLAMEHPDKVDSFVGVAAALRLAKLTHAPDIIYCGGVTGYINPDPEYLPEMANDFPYACDIEAYYEFEHLFDLVERSETRLMFFGGAQIDKYRNVNSTLLGSVDNIKVKLAGGGGTGQIMGKHPIVIIWTAAHEKRGGNCTLVDKVDFITGHGNPPEGVSYPGEIGPTACVTDLGVFSFDKKTGTMKLEALYPDTTVEMILKNTGFKPIIPDKVPTVEPPTKQQIDILRRLADPTGIRKKEFLPKQLERRFKF